MMIEEREAAFHLLEDGNTLSHGGLNENLFKTQHLIAFPRLPFPVGHSALGVLQAIFIAKTSKCAVSREEAG